MKCGPVDRSSSRGLSGNARRRHHQEGDALHAGARDDDNAAADFAFLLVEAMQVTNARRAILVRHHDFPNDAVGETVSWPVSKAGYHVDIGRIVLGDDVATGHAVAAEVTRGPAELGDGERRLADVNHFHAKISRRAGELSLHLKGTGGRKMPSGRSSRPSGYRRHPLRVRSRRSTARCRCSRWASPLRHPRRSFEIAMTQSQGDSVPKERLTADSAGTLGIEARLPRPHGGIWRLGKSHGKACVLKSVRVLTSGRLRRARPGHLAALNAQPASRPRRRSRR